MPSPFPSTAPAIDLSHAPDFPAFQTLHLSNGMPWHLLRDSQNPLAKISLRYDLNAHWTGQPYSLNTLVQLLGEGTKSKTAQAWNSDLDRCGAFVQKSANRNSLLFSLVCRSQNLEKALPLFREMLLDSILSPEEFSMQKELQISDFMQESEQVSEQARRLSSGYLFQNHPLFQDERLEILESMCLEDVHEAYQQCILTQSPTAYASGVLLENHGVLEDFLDSVSPSEPEPYSLPVWQIPEKKELHHAMPGKSQQALRVVGPAPLNSLKEELDFRFMLVLWGGYFGSRLMKNIREEKGFTYGINASPMRLKSASYWMVNTQINGDKKNETLHEMRLEAERLMTKHATNQELQTVRNYLAGSLARSLDGVLNRHDRLMALHGLNMPVDYLYQYHQHLFSVQAEEVRHSAERYLNPETWICASAG